MLVASGDVEDVHVVGLLGRRVHQEDGAAVVRDDAGVGAVAGHLR